MTSTYWPISGVSIQVDQGSAVVTLMRAGKRGAHPLDIGVELVGRDIAEQLGFVADDHPVDGAPVGQRGADAELDLLLVLAPGRG